jgi:hypothetical protein
LRDLAKRRQNRPLKQEAGIRIPQDSKGFWPKDDFAPVLEQAAAVQVQDIISEPKLLCRRPRWRFDIANAHRRITPAIVMSMVQQVTPTMSSRLGHHLSPAR